MLRHGIRLRHLEVSGFRRLTLAHLRPWLQHNSMTLETLVWHAQRSQEEIDIAIWTPCTRLKHITLTSMSRQGMREHEEAILTWIHACALSAMEEKQRASVSEVQDATRFMSVHYPSPAAPLGLVHTLHLSDLCNHASQLLALVSHHPHLRAALLS